MTKGETLEAMRNRKKSRVQVMQDLENVNALLEKMDDWSQVPETKDSTEELPTIKPSRFDPSIFNSLKKRTQDSSVSDEVINKVIKELENIVTTQIKHCCLMLLNQIPNDQMQLTMRILIEKEREFPELKRIYDILKPMAILELSGPTDGLTMLLPFVLNRDSI